MAKQIRYLVDTNIWLELLLEQEKSAVVLKLLTIIPGKQLSVSDFAVHSIGVILSRFKKYDLFQKFLTDLFFNGDIDLFQLDNSDLLNVISNAQKFKLDFDDAYQYTTARKFDLTLITFDKNFLISGFTKYSPDEIVENLEGT